MLKRSMRKWLGIAPDAAEIPEEGGRITGDVEAQEESGVVESGDVEAAAEGGDDPAGAARDWRAEYAALERAFDAYRAEAERREALSARRAAYRRLLNEARIPPRFHDGILRLTALDELELDGDRLRDEDAARAAIRRDWGDFVGVERVRGLSVDAPPALRPPRLTAREIMAIPDDAAREREIARNHELFGF